MNYDTLKVLLVEDDEIDAKNVRRAFQKMHMVNPVTVAFDGIQALEILRGGNGRERFRPALILLDLNMPRMNGLEFLRALRGDPELANETVVVLTTSNEERDVVEAYHYNVAGYILKPVMPEAFFEAMTTINKYWKLCEKPQI